ncbi:MAG: UvrD-helicase domain-containing protein [Acidimicrobiales bacterium]
MTPPGPLQLGRGIVVVDGAAAPSPWADAPVVVIDDAVVVEPRAVVEQLHAAWASRSARVVDLRVDPVVFRRPAVHTAVPWELSPDFELWHDRLHFLVWNNNYDHRTGEPIWWWGRKAARIGGTATDQLPPGQRSPGKAAAGGDLLLPDGTGAWIDGGPPDDVDPASLDGAALIRSDSVDAGRLDPVPAWVAPAAELAADQLAAVSHRGGPARIIAPAGSGKTRVLTERLRHLVADRGHHRSGVLAVAYNRKAQEEMAGRTAELGARIQTLNALGYELIGRRLGRRPNMIDEREVRSRLEPHLPKLTHRLNTDPMAPYLEGLSIVRLGLRDPEEIELEADAPGLADAVEPYRAGLRRDNVLDFDEQVIHAVELLVSDGEFRRAEQARHRHLLVDEFQDLTPAHVLLLRLLAAPTFDVFGVGDDDQCHPAGTLVQTTIGPVPVEMLDPSRHRVVSWDGYESAIRGATPRGPNDSDHGFGFEMAARPYSGRVVELVADGRSLRLTPDHRVYTRWRPDAWSDRRTSLLYLIRKGGHFRVGTCFLNRSAGAPPGLGFRCRQEGADAGWVLEAFSDQDAALVAEKIAVANFGLPQTTSVSPKRRADEHRRIAENFDGIDNMATKAKHLLEAFGRSIEHPFYDQTRRGRMGGCTTAQIMRACNVVDGFMEVPVADGRTVAWATAKAGRLDHTGPVYSLAVEPHHNYVADGIVVRNCIYGHAGATPRFLIGFAELFPGAHEHALQVNYRCPPAIVDAARHLLGYNDQRVDKMIETARADDDADALTVQTHAPDAGATALVTAVRAAVDAAGDPRHVAVLTRTNSLLLAPHVALVGAGVPISSVLRADVLNRVGLRAALAWLRIATDPGNIDGKDLTEISRRPSRGFPRWIDKWLGRCRSGHEVAKAAERIDDARVSEKMLDLAEDIERLSDTADGASTREVLAAIRDDIGLGGAMELLDGRPGAEGSSHLDDLDALLQVADIQPDPELFETYLRRALTADRAPDDELGATGVTLSTVHRVKGREWPHVVVFGANGGLFPHRLTEDVEEERRVFHVAITRGIDQVTVLADAERPSPFIGELDGSAPKRPPLANRVARQGLATSPPARSAPNAAGSASRAAGSASRAAGYDATDLEGEDLVVFEELRKWRAEVAKRQGGPAFTVFNDATLKATARARPDSLRAFSAIKGVGPTKLENYGDDVLEIIRQFT